MIRPSRSLPLVLACTLATSIGAVSSTNAVTASGDVRMHEHAVGTHPVSGAQAHVAHAGALVAAKDATPRETLEQLLGQHSTLAIRLMRGKIAGGPDFAEAASTALGRNTDELTAQVEAAYGSAAGEGFRGLWITHVNALFAYADALQRKDAAGQAEAKSTLDRYNTDYGNTISSVTEGAMSAKDVTAGVKEHVDTLLAQADAFARGDYNKAYELERTAFRHMFATGRALAGAVVSQSGELPANFDDAPAQLRSQLGLLLGEHMELTVDATRAVVTGGDDATAAAGALQGNTADIAKAFGSVFGTAGSRALVQLWADHVDAVVAFAVATARKDAAGTAKARAALDRAARGLGAEFSRLAKGKVAVRAATQALDQHDQQLLTQITAYAQADYGKAHEISYGGYQHMFMIAEVLADAIGANVATKLPRGGAATGGGGLAGTRGGAGFVAGNTALVP